jgi:hypothetical protein
MTNMDCTINRVWTVYLVYKQIQCVRVEYDNCALIDIFDLYILCFDHTIKFERLQVVPAPSRFGPKLKVDSAPFEIKYFWSEIHVFIISKCFWSISILKIQTLEFCVCNQEIDVLVK